MRYTQDSGVRRAGDSDEYKVVVSVYLTPSERDLWGARKVRLALESTSDGQPKGEPVSGKRFSEMTDDEVRALAGVSTSAVVAWLEVPRALLARMAKVHGHIEDMDSDERVWMLGALTGALRNTLAITEAALAVADELMPGPYALNLAGVRAEKGCSEKIRGAMEAALRDAQAGA